MNSHNLKKGVLVSAGRDWHGQHPAKIWGLIPLATKVPAQVTGGGMYIFEHRDMGKGGPPRHIHHEQDEWFYVLAGEYIFEVGDEKFRLKPGDSIFAPRKISHAWACVSDKPGTVVTIVSPAGTFETFIRDTTKHATLPAPQEIEKAFSDHGMTIVGPPLKVD